MDEESLAVDVIDHVGPGGNYLLEDHTAAHCRDNQRASFFNRRRYDAWQQHGGRDIVSEAARQVQARLEAFSAPDLDATTRRQLDDYVLRDR